MTRRNVLARALLVSLIAVPHLAAQCQEAELTSPPAEDARLGELVDISGDWALVNSVDSSGGVIHVYHHVADDWQEVGSLKPSDAAPTGRSLTIDFPFAAIGARQSSSSVVVVFRYDGTAWQQASVLSVSGAVSFGQALDLRAGEMIATDPYGSKAYVFRWDGLQWLQDGILQPDHTLVNAFGQTVSIDGDVAVVGAPDDHWLGDRAGLAFAYRRSGGSWSFAGEVAPPDLESDWRFGISLSISAGQIIVGAPGHQTAHVFGWNSTQWEETTRLFPHPTGINTQFGSAVAIEGTTCVVGALADRQGSFRSGTMYRFRQFGSQWLELARVTSEDGGTSDEFGNAVATSGDHAIVGAHFHLHPGSMVGAAYIDTFEPGAAGESHAYGTGWPGTHGIPELVLAGNPVLCDSPVLTIGNSRGITTIGLALAGSEAAFIDTGLGGALLLEPTMFVPVAIPGSGLSLAIPLPCDPGLAGFTAYLQVLERDPGASRGVSFTQGLAATLGRCP